MRLWHKDLISILPHTHYNNLKLEDLLKQSNFIIKKE